jgi:hypothetical protein
MCTIDQNRAWDEEIFAEEKKEWDPVLENL